MPPKKSAHAAAATIARSVHAEKKAALSSKSAKEDLFNDLQNAKLWIQQLEQELAKKKAEYKRLFSDLEKLGQKVEKQRGEISL